MLSKRLLTVIGSSVRSNKLRQLSSARTQLTNAEVRQKRNVLFDKEKARQVALVTRVEKIEVEHAGLSEKCTLLMNKGLSTPFNCAMHISELLMNRSSLALVNGKPWDMHRPLIEDCQLEFLHFKDEDPTISNMAFWRSCSFILGHILETAFKDKFYVELCSFPKPNVRAGSFVYDVDLKNPDWKPTQQELRSLGRIGAALKEKEYKFERLDVDAKVAEAMFEDNRFKSRQIPVIVAQSRTGSTVPLYRMKDHIDISNGPMVASTACIGRFSLSAIHSLASDTYGSLQRVQGLALPVQLRIHHWTYDFLSDCSKKMNTALVPNLQEKLEESSPNQECQT